MKKKYAFLLLSVLIIACMSCGGPVDESNELLKNGSFEIVDGGMPASWRKDAYDIGNRTIHFRVEEGAAHSGNQYAVIENITVSDSRYIQNVTVQPDSYYKLSAWVKAEGVPRDQKGANISIMDVFAAAGNVQEDSTKWKYIELFGKTGPGQRSLVVACRLGGYGEESRGKAYFDDISLRKLSGQPAGKRVESFYKDKKEQAAAEKEKVPLSVQEARKKTNAFFWMILFSYVFLGLYFFVYHFYLKKDRFRVEDQTKQIILLFGIFMGVAFIIRVIMGYYIEGMAGDLGCFKGWGLHATTTPWPDYYDYYSAYIGKAEYWCDYPPVYIMILALLGAIKNILNLGHQAFTLLIKMPNIVSDIICCFLIFRLARRHLHDSGALGLTLLYAFNPAIIINSAVWGQADAIYTLLALLIVVFILRRQYWISGIILGAALLIKIQTGFVAFAGIFALIERKTVKDWVTTMGASLGTFILLTLPFGIKLPFEWIIVQLIGTLTGYPYASVNAFNFFALFKGNWLPTSQPILFGMSADFWGICIGYFVVVFMIFIYFWSKEDSKNFYIGMFAMASIFMFIPGMHERYHYAVIIFSLMTYLYSKDRRFLYLFLGFSTSVFVNVYHILDVFIVGDLSNVPASYYYPIDPAKEPVLLINALANCFLFGYMVKVGVDVYIRNRFVVDKGIVYKTPMEVSKEKLKQLRRKLTESAKNKIVSPVRNLIFITGLISVLIPFVGIYPWIVGRKEMKTYPEDRVLRAGNLLGRGVAILWIVMIVMGIIVAPIVMSGLIKLP